MLAAGSVAGWVFGDLLWIHPQLLRSIIQQVPGWSLVGLERPARIAQQTQLDGEAQAVMAPPPGIHPSNILFRQLPVPNHIAATK